ncbi:MAG: sulfatase, partial [Armatimonadetes bacterium]|nr:sulfatase [Armatimonadota bacterium]
MHPRFFGRLLFAAATLVIVAGCARPQPSKPLPPEPTLVLETGQEMVLSAGRAFHFTDEFEGGENPEGLPVSSDGAARLVLQDARVPVLSAPAPYQIKQKLRLPEGGTFRAGFGLTRGSWDKAGGGARFVVRLRVGDEIKEVLSEQVNRWRGEDSPNWHPVSIELPASVKPVEIELSTEVVGTIPEGGAQARAGSYAVWLDPTVIAAPAAPRPNVLLVVIDAFRADRLGCYGYARNTSPNLDRLARRGIVFEEASSQATWTFPSLHSLLTSSYRFLRGQRLGQLGPGGVPAQPISMPTSLQGSLRAAGYETLACVGGGFLDPVLGFDTGFDWYWSPSHTPMLANQLSVVMDRLQERSEQPFFLLLHTYEVHNYFQGWAHCIEDFDSGYLGPLTDPRKLMAILHADPSDFAPADLRYIHDLYDGEIKHTDRYLGLFLEWLRSQPGGENTIIIVTADHGEGLGGHGEMSHGGAPYRDQVHVPLLVFVPGKQPARIATPVALADIMPTVLDLVGEEIPSGVRGRAVHSLTTSGTEPVPIFAESRGAPIMARDGDWWYLTWRGEKEELY